MKRSLAARFAIVLALEFLLSATAQMAGEQGFVPIGLKAAMDKEVLGDVKGAIEEYRKVANGKDRALAAQALFRMAVCHQKLGDAEARRLYEQIIREFGDQKDIAAAARAGLAALRPAQVSALNPRSQAHLTVVSDTTNIAEDGEPAALYATPYNPRWTTSIPEAMWIWKTKAIANPRVEETHRFTKTFFVDGKILAATPQIAADNDFIADINDLPVTPGVVRDSYSRPNFYSVVSSLREGKNTISIVVINTPNATCAYPPPQCNAAGLLYRLDVDFLPAARK